MKTFAILPIILLSLLLSNCVQNSRENPASKQDNNVKKKLIATVYNSDFPPAQDSYNGISSASDGKIYYILCTATHDVGAQMYCFDPEKKEIKHLGDLNEICGEKDAVAQGKTHVNFIESKGKLYFGTHTGFSERRDGVVLIGNPPEGYRHYQGGHIISYDLKTGKFEKLATEPHREGILTMNMDTARSIIYGLSWPTGYMFRYDLINQEMTDLGPISRKGHAGKGEEYRALCRTIVVNPDDGTAYVTTVEGTILKCRLGKDRIEPLEGEDMKKDYFGQYDPNEQGHMGYNWRQVIWAPNQKKFYGVHGNSGYLFSFDPKIPRVEVLDRITSEPSRLSGMYDLFSFGYLGFILASDQRTLYYLTGAPIYSEGKRIAAKSTTKSGEAKGKENVHLVTYDIPSSKYTDHGPVFFPNGEPPLYVNSIALDKNGTIYAIARIIENGKMRRDLISIPNPFK